MATQERLAAAGAYTKALSTGDRAAATEAAPHLAQDIVVQVGNRTFEGYDDALERITGIWPQTPVYRKGEWAAPAEENGNVVVHGTMAPVGAGPSKVNLTFAFNDEDKISRVDVENIVGTELFEVSELPAFVCEAVNTALFNDTPLSVSYVDGDGKPKLSLRGSVRAYGAQALSIWARKESGLADAIQSNPNMSLLFRDNPTRSTLIFTGQGPHRRGRHPAQADIRRDAGSGAEPRVLDLRRSGHHRVGHRGRRDTGWPRALPPLVSSQP